MLISRKTLLSFLPNLKDKSFDEFNHACFNLGLEIEQVLTHPNNEGFCVGQIQHIGSVPNSDKLHLVTVLVNETANTTKEIVCGAKELAVGWKVVVANVGAKLHDGRIIEEKTLMGVKSQGMLCGYNELTPLNHEYLDEYNQNGIVVLDPNTPIGATNINELLGFDDEIYDLSLPTNRNDYTGALFVINDLSRFFNQEFTITESQLDVEIDNKLPDFYCSAVFKTNNDVNDSWEINKNLLNDGIKLSTPTLNYVNYFSYLTGVYPLIFDYDKVKNKKITLGKHNGLLTINNQQYDLNNDQCLMIDKTVIAIDKIGVVDQFRPDLNTKTFLLILTKTDPKSIRGAAVRLNLLTSYTKANLKLPSELQLNLFLKMLSNNFKVKVHSLPKIAEPTKKIPFDIKACLKFIGIRKEDVVFDILKQWNYVLSTSKKSVLVPSYRSDLINDHDLYEEILKLYTFASLEPKPISANILIHQGFDQYAFINKLEKLLTSNYINQVKTYNLTSEEEVDKLNYHNLSPLLRVVPCSNNAREFMRLSLAHNLLKIMSYNANHKNDLLPIFEIQKIYNQDIFTDLTVIAPSTITIDPINDIKANFNTLGLKNLAREIANLLKIELTFQKSESKYLYDNDNLEIFSEGKKVGFCGCIRANILKDYKLNQFNLFILNINLKNIVEHTNSTVCEIKEFDEVPLVYRDITFNVDKTKDLKVLINNLDNLKFINNYHFTKAYKLNPTEIAYTIHLALASENKVTLTKEDIDSYIEQVNSVIKNSL